jgi:hypothetical protein
MALNGKAGETSTVVCDLDSSTLFFSICTRAIENSNTENIYNIIVQEVVSNPIAKKGGERFLIVTTRDTDTVTEIYLFFT